MGCLKKTDTKAVSELIGMLLVLTIITTTVTATLVWMVPYVNDSKAEAQSDNVYSQLYILNEVFNTLINQGRNSSSFSNIMIEQGDVVIDNVGDRVVIYYSLDSNYDFNVTGLEYNSDSFTIHKVNPTAINIDVYVKRLDLDLSDSLGGDDSSPKEVYTLNSLGFEVKNSVRIDLIDKDSSDYEFGKIWIFDLGLIKYQINSNANIRKVISENLGVLRSFDNSFILEKTPKNFIFNSSDKTVINILQMRSGDGYSGFGGAGILKIEALNNETNIYQMNNQTFDFIKLRFYGDNADAWENYWFLRDYIYKWSDSEGYILYLKGDKYFTLVQNLFNVNIEVI